MNKIFMLMLPILSLFMSGCASVMSGTEQDIAMHSNPEGAECVLTREAQLLRKVVTPDTVRVSKLKHDIYVSCNMEGFHESTAHVNSGTQGSVFGNILLGGGIGWAIDSARGADNKYADVVTVTMVPLMQEKPDAVMIGVDGQVLTKEQVETLKAETAKKTSQTEGVETASEVIAADDMVVETSETTIAVEATPEIVSEESVEEVIEISETAEPIAESAISNE